MAARNLLHKSKLNDFKFFLDDKGLAYRQGKGDYQTLQVQHPTHGWQPIYEKLESPEHYSVPDKLIPLVMEFIKDCRGERRPCEDYRAGQYWYCRYPGGTTLVKLEVLEVTEKTVLVREMKVAARDQRFARYDLEFIEECNETD